MIQKALRTYGTEINDLCEKMKITVSNSIGSGPVDAGTFASKVRNSSKRRQAIYDKKLAPYMNELSSQIMAKQKKLQRENHGIATLLYTPSMRDIFPIDSDYIKDCAHPKKDSSINPKKIAYQSIQYAKTEMRNFITDDLASTAKGLLAQYSKGAKNISEQIQSYLKYKPYLLGQYLKKLDTTENKDLLAKYTCIQTNKIYSSDERWNIGTMTGGVIVGLAAGAITAGFGAGIGASLIAGGAITATEGTGIYIVDRNEAENIATGTAIGKVSDSIDHDQFVKLESVASDYEFSAYMSAGTMIAAPLGHTAKTAYSISKARRLNKTGQFVPGKTKRPLPEVTNDELMTRDSQKRIQAIKKYMRDNGHLGPNEQLSLERKKAIISAHKVGGPQKGYLDEIKCPPVKSDCKPIHNYSDEDLDDKIRALRGDGEKPLFPRLVREYAMRSGTTGNKLSKKQISKQAQKNKNKKNGQVVESKNQKNKKNKNRGVASDTPEKIAADKKLIEKTMSEVSRLKCFMNNTCTDFITRATPALEQIIKKYENGSGIVSRYINFFKGNDFATLDIPQLTILKECLIFHKGKLNCSPKQLEVVLKFMETKWNPAPHPNFYKRILRSIGFDESHTKFERALRFIVNEHNPSQKGSIVGKVDKVTLDANKRPRINGELITGEKDPLVIALSIEREGQAIRHLSELGFEVTVLPTSKEARKKLGQGVQRNFERLSDIANIGAGKNPDLILDGEFIADIYSPLRDLDLDSVKRVVKRVLTKAEGKNYTTSYLKDGEEVFVNGERQTNRVVIYADEHQGDIKEIANSIRNEIGENNPSHLEEAFILFKDEAGKPQLINVWP